MATNFFDSMAAGINQRPAREWNSDIKLPRLVRAALIVGMSAGLWAGIVSLAF